MRTVGRARARRRSWSAALKAGIAGLGLAVIGLAAAPPSPASAAASAAAEGTRFSSYIDDLPIMPGLTETSDGYVVDLFQGGRLAQAHLAGEVDAQVVRGFYTATLAQLGWKASPTEPYVYHRGRDKLTFAIETRKPARRGGRPPKGLEAVFALTPEAGAPGGRP